MVSISTAERTSWRWREQSTFCAPLQSTHFFRWRDQNCTHNIQWEMYNSSEGTTRKTSFCEQATRGGSTQNSFRIFHVYLSMTRIFQVFTYQWLQDLSGIYLSVTFYSVFAIVIKFVMIDIRCDECIWHHKKIPGATALTLCNKVVLFAEPELMCCYTSCYTVTLFCVVLLHAISVLFNLLCLDLSHCSLWRTFLQNKQQQKEKKEREKKAKPTKQTNKKHNKNNNNKELPATDAFPIS